MAGEVTYCKGTAMYSWINEYPHRMKIDRAPVDQYIRFDRILRHHNILHMLLGDQVGFVTLADLTTAKILY